MADGNVIGRIKYLIQELRMNQSMFAQRIDCDPSNLSKHLTGKLPVNDSLLNKIVVNVGVSKAWLKDGIDVPFPKVQAPALISVPGISEKAQGTPVYDVDVTAGAMSREMMFADDRIIGWINVPGVGEDCKIVKVSGDSMQPVINNGDYIAVREIRDTSIIFWGQIYVVLLEDYRMVKYLRRHSEPDMLILRSENPDYDDIELPKSSVKGLFFVNSIIHIDSRM